MKKMIINDIKYKDYVEEISKTFSPLNWFLKIFSLQCCSNKGNDIPPYRDIIRIAVSGIVLSSFNLFTLYYKLTCFYKDLIISVKYADMVQLVYDIIQYCIDLYFVHMYGSNMFYEYIKQYAYIDGMLGMVYYANIKRQLIKVMIFFLFIWISSSIYDFVIWAIGFGLISTSTFSIAYIYMLIKILTNLHLTLNIMHIESRLRVMGDLIQECYGASTSSSTKIEDAVTKKNWFYCKDITSRTSTSKLYPLKSITRMDWHEVKWLNRCYLLLTEQVKYINKLFGMRVLLNTLSLLIDMIRFTNLTVRILMGSQNTGYSHGYYPAISTLWRAVNTVTVIVSLMYHCENTYRQRERIICLLDHLLIDKNLGDKLLTSYTELRDLVQSRPINFHMAHFMRLDYPLLVSITSVFVTYTIILIQSI